MAIKLQVTTSGHKMPCIELRGCDKKTREVIRSAMLCNYMQDPRYVLKMRAGAFLQGFDEYGEGWLLMEFWQPDYQPFVDLLQELVNEE